jgi:hypothetical protein
MENFMVVQNFHTVEARNKFKILGGAPMKLAQPQIPSAEKFWGRSPSRRAKRKGVGGKEFLPACFRSRSV